MFSSIVEAIAKKYDGWRYGSSASFLHTVKLIHADDLQEWDALREYDEHDSITYAEYLDGLRRIRALKRQVGSITRAMQRLEVLETGDLEEYDTIEIAVPRSLLRKELVIPLPDPPYEGTRMKCWDGRIEGGNLLVKGKWREQTVLVYRSCPSDILHEEELDSIRKMLQELPQADLEKLHEIETSRFSQPVLFISHRWESATHPDPEGRQLEKLSVLRNCFIVYDYSSFPQRTTNESERAALEEVLANMNRLIDNVVILESPTYVERGWCIYEYLLASLTKSTVCDEIRDPDFVQLRNLTATQAPPESPEEWLMDAFGMDKRSREAQIQNRIGAEVLRTVDRILPRFRQSRFTIEDDREIVMKLLIEQLMHTLPKRKEYQTYIGVWNTVSWTREELRNALEGKLQVGEGFMETWEDLDVYALDVPEALQEAVARGYALDKGPPIVFKTWLEKALKGQSF